MKVRDLIFRLKQCPPEAEVVRWIGGSVWHYCYTKDLNEIRLIPKAIDGKEGGGQEAINPDDPEAIDAVLLK